MAPTARPSVLADSEAAGLFFEIDGDATFPVEFKHITAGNLQAIPVGGTAVALEGPVVVTTSCDPTSDAEVAGRLDGSILIVARSCNVHKTSRTAAERGVIAVAFATDGAAAHRWVPRDRALTLPVLAMEYAAAASAQTMLRRGKDVRGRLSSRPYCDVMHASGVDTASAASVGGGRCCVAGDIISAYLLQQHDFWHVGVREFPFCREAGNGSDSGLAMGCAEPSALFGVDEPTVCSDLCKRNGVCEDGGIGSVGHSCAWGGDCQGDPLCVCVFFRMSYIFASPPHYLFFFNHILPLFPIPSPQSSLFVAGGRKRDAAKGRNGLWLEVEGSALKVCHSEIRFAALYQTADLAAWPTVHWRVSRTRDQRGRSTTKPSSSCAAARKEHAARMR
jgi:hypothetical protein